MVAQQSNILKIQHLITRQSHLCTCMTHFPVNSPLHNSPVWCTPLDIPDIHTCTTHFPVNTPMDIASTVNSPVWWTPSDTPDAHTCTMHSQLTLQRILLQQWTHLYDAFLTCMMHSIRYSCAMASLQLTTCSRTPGKTNWWHTQPHHQLMTWYNSLLAAFLSLVSSSQRLM